MWSRQSRRSRKLSHTQTSVPCGTLNHEDIGGSSNTESTVLGTDTMHVLYTLQTHTKKITVHLISVENTKS